MGELEVLSVGRGHLTISVTNGSEEDRVKARAMIEDMLKRGYSIFVETEPGKPLTRVRKFNPKRLTYIVGDGPAGEIPAEKAKATAVGRTSGG